MDSLLAQTDSMGSTQTAGGSEGGECGAPQEESNASSYGENAEEPWQTKVTTLKSGIAEIYKRKEFADVHFKVGSRIFKGHKLILVARSPEFSKILFKRNNDMRMHTLDDVSEDGFEHLLHYIYTDEVKELEGDILLEVYRAAVKFQQKGLLNKCRKLVSEREITRDNVFSFLNKTCDIPELKEKCVNYLKKNTSSILESDGFLEANISTLQTVFDAGIFQHVPTVLLLTNVLRWGANEFPAQEDYKLVRQLLLDTNILGRLGFEKLKGEELAEVMDKHKGILTAEEVSVFFLNNFRPGSITLPEWCNIPKTDL